MIVMELGEASEFTPTTAPKYVGYLIYIIRARGVDLYIGSSSNPLRSWARQRHPSSSSRIGRAYRMHLPESGAWEMHLASLADLGAKTVTGAVRELIHSRNPVFNVTNNIQTPDLPTWLFASDEGKQLKRQLLHAREAWVHGAFDRSLLSQK